MPPYAGQGASMALEDAVTLAMCLRDRPDVPAAFAAYQSIRRPRQARVAAVTANNGRTLAARNPVSRWLRNRMIPIGLRVSADSALWINSHEIDWDRPVQVPA
jgi:2-polyprenyl-6-methoxyphenol hydroxylase-like FAD-dependent oxidoreductase